MSSDKKRIRKQFRDAVFERDKHECRVCGSSSDVVNEEGDWGEVHLDAHHITDRNSMPSGGYVSANGISLCPPCHEKAEVFHSTGTPHPGYAPDDLYRLIGSSHEAAVKAAERLK